MARRSFIGKNSFHQVHSPSSFFFFIFFLLFFLFRWKIEFTKLDQTSLENQARQNFPLSHGKSTSIFLPAGGAGETFSSPGAPAHRERERLPIGRDAGAETPLYRFYQARCTFHGAKFCTALFGSERHSSYIAVAPLLSFFPSVQNGIKRFHCPTTKSIEIREDLFLPPPPFPSLREKIKETDCFLFFGDKTADAVLLFFELQRQWDRHREFENNWKIVVAETVISCED